MPGTPESLSRRTQVAATLILPLLAGALLLLLRANPQTADSLDYALFESFLDPTSRPCAPGTGNAS